MIVSYLVTTIIILSLNHSFMFSYYFILVRGQVDPDSSEGRETPVHHKAGHTHIFIHTLIHA